MKTKISFEMWQLALASLVATLFIIFIYFLLFYPSGMIMSASGVVYSLLIWFSFLGANMYREYLKLKKKVAEEIEAEKKLIAEKEEAEKTAEKTAKKNRINLLKPISTIKKSDVLFIARLYNNGELDQLDPNFKFDRILEIPIYKFLKINESKKQIIFNEVGSIFQFYSHLYFRCINDKTLKVIVKNIVEIGDLVVSFRENNYKGSRELHEVFKNYLTEATKDILKNDFIDDADLQLIGYSEIPEMAE